MMRGGQGAIQEGEGGVGGLGIGCEVGVRV